MNIMKKSVNYGNKEQKSTINWHRLEEIPGQLLHNSNMMITVITHQQSSFKTSNTQ